GEQEIVGWQFRVFSHNNLQVQKEAPLCAYVRAGLYSFVERRPNELNWTNSTPNGAEEDVDTDYTENITFGNVCVGAGGANEGTFWAGLDGKALITPADLTFMSSLYLRNATGAHSNTATTKAPSDCLGTARST